MRPEPFESQFLPRTAVFVGGPLHGQTRRLEGSARTVEVPIFTPQVEVLRPEDPCAPWLRSVIYERRVLNLKNDSIKALVTVWAPRTMEPREVERLVKTLRTDILTGGLL